MSSRNKTDVKKIFEFWCKVKRAHGLGKSDYNAGHAHNNTPSGIIVESFPENFRDEKTISDIPAFAFPCEFESDSVQSYSFVLTTDDSKWRFGFCRHDPKTDSAMVMITHLPWHDTFLRLLTVLAELRRTSQSDFQTFLAETYNRGVPDPGGHLKIFYNAGENWFVFERPLQFQLPSIPENHNLNLYYNFVDPKNMIAVFAAMMAERRIIFTSRRLDRLSSCIQAANAFLYPMVWQHIFIPVLPMKLKDYLSAPMPYLIGVPESVLETMLPEELGEVVILNCDTKIFESPFDDVHEMPVEIVAHLKKQLSNTHEHIGDRVSKLFLGVLVQLIGGYRDAVEFRDTGKTFNREKFIESRPSSLRPFLTKMMQLQIFQQFIDERLQMLNTGLGFSDEFELETVRYAEKMKKRGRVNIFKNVKDKTNPAVKSAVKSVKESSRGVKTYYKDLKTKWRDVTPPSTGTHHKHFQSHLNSNSQHDSIDGANFPSVKMTGGHHSAPSSPIFSKRASSSTNPLGAGGYHYGSPTVPFGNGGSKHLRLSPLHLATSSSSARVQDTINGGSVASPSISPTSSLASSEMNLSQELQNHPLFKTPIVDRTLKPCYSLEANHRVITTTPTTASSISLSRQKPITASAARFRQTTTPATYYNHPYNSQQQSQPLQQRTTPNHTHQEQHTTQNHKIVTTASHYDNPPDMLSPPVPPRRQNGHATSSVSHTGLVRLERHNNGWQRYETNVGDEPTQHNYSSSSNTSSVSSATASILSSSSLTSDSSASFVSATSTFSHLSPIQQQHQIQQHQPPVPAPRLRKEKEQSLRLHQHKVAATTTTTTTSMAPTKNGLAESSDLITLDDSNNTSFELEDFDPLNQNARPLPALTRSYNSKKATTLPAKARATSQLIAGQMISQNASSLYAQLAARPSVNHSILSTSVRPPRPPPPVLSGQQPPPLPKSLPPAMPKGPMANDDNDYELLRKYGLDQFSLPAATTATETTTTLSAIGTTAGANKYNNNNNCRNNWTTFD